MRRILVVLSSLLVIGSAGHTATESRVRVDLSPVHWPAGDLDRYMELNTRGQRRKPRATSDLGMVVGTTGALAIRAGVEALRQGGSATDAAIVTALTQTTLAAGSWVSYAGIFTLLHYNASNRKLAYLNGEFNTLLEEDDPLSIPATGGRTALVPGFMAAVEAAHDRFGVLPWESLFAPAIYFAEEGFVVDAELAATMDFRRTVLHRLPETREIFFKPDGSLPRAGETFRQPQLAGTLEQVANRGAFYMYEGAWADRLVDAVRREGGRLTAADLARYRPIWKKPRKINYRRHRVRAPGTPGAGGKLAATTFKQLKGVPLSELGHYTESADALFEMLSATRAAYRHVPPLDHSDAVVTVDSQGNVAALLHSINTSAWGETGIFVDGVSIPDPAAHQQHRIQTAGPGNRIWTGTNPMIVIRKRKPVLAGSAIGRGLFEASVQAIVNVLDYGMDPKEAVDTINFRAPRRDQQGGITHTLVTRREFPADLLEAVRNMGIPILEMPLTNFEATGFWVGVSIDPRSGEITGAANNQFNGIAEGQ